MKMFVGVSREMQGVSSAEARVNGLAKKFVLWD